MSEHHSTDDDDDDSSLESETYPPGYHEDVAEEDVDSLPPQMDKARQPTVSKFPAIEEIMKCDNMVDGPRLEISHPPDDIDDGSSDDAEDEDDDDDDEFDSSEHVSDAVKQAQQALSQLQQLDILRHPVSSDSREHNISIPVDSTTLPLPVANNPTGNYYDNDESDSNDDDTDNDDDDPVNNGSMLPPHLGGDSAPLDTPVRRNFVCTYCERAFASVKALQSHTIKIHNPEKLNLLQCNVCFKTFLDENKLQEHQSSHNVENTHPCPKCARRFKSKLKLRDHMACHNPEQRLCCPFSNCEKSFVSKKLYDNHVAKHDNQQLIFTCPVCDMEFKRRSHRSEHVRVAHAGVKAYQCTHPGCNHRFTTENARDNHVTRAHQGSRRYRCSQCHFSASHAPQLEEHCREEHPNMDLSLTARSVHSLPPHNTSFPMDSDSSHAIPGTSTIVSHSNIAASSLYNTPSLASQQTSSTTSNSLPQITQQSTQISSSKSCDTSITGVPNCFDLEDPTVSNLKQTVNGILADLDRDLYLPKPPVTASTVVSPPTTLLPPDTPDHYPNLSRVICDVLNEVEYSACTTSRWQPNCDTFSTEEWMQLQNEERDMGPSIAGCCVLDYPFLLSDDISAGFNNAALYVDIFSPKSGMQQGTSLPKRRGRPKKNALLPESSPAFLCEGKVGTPSHLLSPTHKMCMSPDKGERRTVEHSMMSQSGKDELRQRGYCDDSVHMHNRLSSPGRGDLGVEHSAMFNPAIDSLHQYPFQSSSTSPPSSLSNPITSHRPSKGEHASALSNSNGQTGFTVNDESMAILNEIMGGVPCAVGKGRGYPPFHQIREDNPRLHSPSGDGGVDLSAQLLSLAAYRHQRQGHLIEDHENMGSAEVSQSSTSHLGQHNYDDSSVNVVSRWNPDDASTSQSNAHDQQRQQQQQLEYSGSSPHTSIGGGVMSPSSMPMAALSAADLLRQYGACIDSSLNPETPSSISVWPTSQTALQSAAASDNWNTTSTSLPNALFESASARSLQQASSQHQPSQGSAPQSSQHSLYSSSHPRVTIPSVTSNSYQSPPEHSPSPTPLSAHQQQAAMAAMAAAMYHQNPNTPAFDAAAAVAQSPRANQSLAAMEYHRNLMSANSANPYAATELYYQMAAANAAAYGKYSQLGICSPTGISSLYGGSGSGSTQNGTDSTAVAAAELSAMQRFAGLSMPPSALYSREAAYLSGQSAAAFYAAAAASQAANAPNSYVNSPLMSPHMAYAAASMSGIPSASPGGVSGAMDYLAAAGRQLAADPYNPGYLPHLQ